MQSLYFLIPLFFILIFILPIRVKTKVSLDVLRNKGGIGFFIFGIKIKSFLFCFKGKNLMLYEDKDVKKIDFEGGKFLKAFLIQSSHKVRLKKVDVFYNIGVGDAFLTALLCGWINLIFDVSFLKLKDLKPTASFCLTENVAFNETKFDLSSNLKISISLLDVVYSFANSVILTLKESKTR